MLSHMLSNLKVNQSHLLAWQVEFTSFSSLIIEPWLYSNNPLKEVKVEVRNPGTLVAYLFTPNE